MLLFLFNAVSSHLKFGYSWLIKLKETALKATIRMVPKTSSVEADTTLMEITRVISSRMVSTKLKFAILLDDSGTVVSVQDPRISRWGVERLSLPGGFSKSDLYATLGYLTHYHSFLNLEPRYQSDKTGLVRLDVTRLGPVTGVSHPSLRHPEGPNLVTDGVADIVADPKIPYGFRISNNSDQDLYAYLYYLDNHEFSIAPYYVSRNTPLKSHQSLTIGYGTNPGPPAYAYYLKEGINIEVGFLKLLMSKEPLEEQHVASKENWETRDIESIERLAMNVCDAVTVTVVQRMQQA